MTQTLARTTDLNQAFAACERLAKSHYENFTVGSWFLPKRLRPSMHAVYAFCRHTDDLGDEATGDRLALLNTWEADLRQCYGGAPEHPYLQALQATIQRHHMPMDIFLRLIEANRMDQRVKRYATYQDLLHYCEHSATPVGRMVLHVFGYRDEERGRLSDATCIALQLANFWQDVRRDLAMGRIYIPLEDMARFGYSETDLHSGVVNGNLRRLMEFEVGRARGLFREGLTLVERVDGELRLDLRLFSEGGLSILDAIEGRDYDVLTTRPTVPKSKKLLMMFTGFARLAAMKLPGRPRRG